jgi:hypothetical protein
MSSKFDYIVDSEMNSKPSFETPSSNDVGEGAVKKPTAATGLKLWLQKLSVETGGIERVTDEQRDKNPSKVWNACTFWYVEVPLATPSESC